MLALWRPQVNDSKGHPVVIKNAICLHEEDAGILWKHVDGEWAAAQLSSATQHVPVCCWRVCAVSLIARLHFLGHPAPAGLFVQSWTLGLLHHTYCHTALKPSHASLICPVSRCCLAPCCSAHRPCGGAALQEAGVPTNLNVHGEAPSNSPVHFCEGVCLLRCCSVACALPLVTQWMQAAGRPFYSLTSQPPCNHQADAAPASRAALSLPCPALLARTTST